MKCMDMNIFTLFIVEKPFSEKTLVAGAIKIILIGFITSF